MKEKQIEEMAEAIFHNCNCGLFFSEAEKIARFVIEEQGYVKQSEVAKEIFEDIEKLKLTKFDWQDYVDWEGISELKKKYTGEKEDE